MLKENNIYEVSYLESALGFVPGSCVLLVRETGGLCLLPWVRGKCYQCLFFWALCAYCLMQHQYHLKTHPKDAPQACATGIPGVRCRMLITLPILSFATFQSGLSYPEYHPAIVTATEHPLAP